MKKKIVSIASVLLASAVLAVGGNAYAVRYSSAEQTPPLKEIDVYLMAGQSNMVGTSRLELLDDQYKVDYPNVKIYNGGDGPQSERNQWVTVRDRKSVV